MLYSTLLLAVVWRCSRQSNNRPGKIIIRLVSNNEDSRYFTHLRGARNIVTRLEILEASLLTGKFRKHNLPAHALSRKALYLRSLSNI